MAETSRNDPPAVELIGITKAFPGVIANDDVTLSFRPGEIHCLLGENGAGKSTLMSVLSGMYQPDAGEIRVKGKPQRIENPSDALAHGIGMVYQHVTMAPSFSALENLMLGAEGSFVLDHREARKRFDELAGLLDVSLDPDARSTSFALGQKQQIDIMRALWKGSDVLILDEPTSMLTPQGVRELIEVIQRLKDEGLAVIFITHKLHEAISMSDRISILRQGRVVGEIDPEDLRDLSKAEIHDRIIVMMFGAEASNVSTIGELADDIGHARSMWRQRPCGEPVFEIFGASADGIEEGEIGINDVSFQVVPGEILGIAGVDGNGQRALAEVLAGQRPLVAGEVRYRGESIASLSIHERQRLGIRYVTDDAMGEGVVGTFPVSLNLVAKRLGDEPFWNGRMMQLDQIEHVAEELVQEFDIRTPSVHTRVAALSGGNIRKALLARELSSDPSVVVYNKPTSGLDVKTITAVRNRIVEQAEQHRVASIVISTELEELFELCHRIAVMFQGRITGIVDNRPDQAVDEQVGSLMVGRYVS